MSQQPQTQTGVQGAQGTAGGQIGGQASMHGQQQGSMQAGRLPQQQRAALTNVAQAIEVCEWCADRCIQEADPNMIECIRLCEDVAELGETTLSLVPRNSRFGQSVVQSFQQAVQACGQECSRHPHDHCQECARVLSQVAGTTQQLSQPSGQQVGQ